MPDVQLKISGQVHRGWKSIRIRRSLEQIADSFDLTLTDRWENNQAPRDIKTGNECEIWIDDIKVIVGYIDKVLPTYDANNHSLNVSGRSKAGDLVDCSIPGKTFNQRTLLQIASELCKPFDISVSSDTDIGGPFKKQVLEDGQSIFEFIESLARIRAVRIVSDVDGNITFVRTGKQKIKTPLKLGKNIKSASGDFSSNELFSEYVVSGQQTGSDTTFGDAAAHTTSKIVSKHINRYRPTLILVDNPADIADCKKRGEWQRNTSFGRGRSVVYTVNSWYHDDGLWEPNKMVPVSDAYAGINEDRLIPSVDLILDEGGFRSEIQVVPKEAFNLIPLPEPKSEEGFGS